MKKKIKQGGNCPIFHHVGVYAYRPEILLRYKKWKQSNLEALEKLNQLRFLENGCAIKCVLVDEGESLGLNNPEDVVKIENIISEVTNTKGRK